MTKKENEKKHNSSIMINEPTRHVKLLLASIKQLKSQPMRKWRTREFLKSQLILLKRYMKVAHEITIRD